MKTLQTLIVAAILAATCASAGTLTLSGFDNTRSGVVVWPYFNNGSYQVGGMIGSVDGEDVSPLFCVDFFTFIDFNTNYQTDPSFPRTLRNEERVMWLYVNHLADTIDEGIAMQFAFWDIVHDSGDGWAAGSMNSTVANLSTTQLSLFNHYLAISAGQAQFTGASIYVNYDLNLAPAQNLIGRPLANPEPGSILLGATGLAAIAILRRRRAAAS